VILSADASGHTLPSLKNLKRDANTVDTLYYFG
jgi:hypothetical protein